MKQENSFDDLIQAIQDAFIKVNNMAEAQHLQKISAYFNPDSTPKTFDISYPTIDAEGNFEHKLVSVPAICLLPMSSLKLDEVEVDFKVRLYGGVKLKSERKPPEREEPNQMSSNLLCTSRHEESEKDNLFLGYFPQGSSRKSKDDNYADIRLKFVSDEPPEGLMKIQDQYTKISL